MARKHNSKKDSQAKARARTDAAKAKEPAAKEWIELRHEEEQAKMDNSAVKDVTYDPVFTPAAADPDAVTSRSKSVPPVDPDWKEKMQARGKADALPHNATAAQDAEGTTRGKPASRGKVDASRVAANTKAANRTASRSARPAKAAKGSRAASSATAPRKAARKANRRRTVKTG